MSDIALRFNSNKVELTRIPIDAQLEEARVWMKGSIKYPDVAVDMANWEKLWGDRTLKICMDSLLRHAAAIMQGESNDPETGLLHAAHIRANAAMIIRYQLQERAQVEDACVHSPL